MWAFAVVSVVVAISRVVSSQSTATPVPVTGVRTGIDHNTGERPRRLNINDFYARGGLQWDLYIQALQAFQDVNETDPLSYFQISGIHGYPVQSWNGVEQVPGGINLGYCPHNEILFATWHRPFVALFEQELVKHAVRIAKLYTRNGPTYQAAAQSLRQPYWDWASDRNLPIAATLPNLTINAYNGTATVSNPLRRYRFQRMPNFGGSGDVPLLHSETIRCADAAGTDDPAKSNYNLNLNTTGDLTGQVYMAFTQAPRFEEMATAATPGSSFELPHNNVHNAAGCDNGTLRNIGWSAFEPLFMLHHANVDRLIAMWQAIHYNSSILNTTSLALGTYGTANGTIVDADTPLKPFYDTNTTFHTSRTASDIRTFGYTYPEINDWNTTPDQLASFVTSRVNDLYGQGTDGSPPKPALNPEKVAASPSQLVSYSAEIRVERSEVPLPCNIDLVLGDHVLGRIALLGMPMSGVSYGTIPLGEALQKLNLGGMKEDTLVPYLQRHLEVIVRNSDGTVFSKRSTIPGLGVELQVRDFVPRASDTEFPKYGVARRMPVIKHA
ncbi:hypothetical protein GE09DRAFT_740262 [Coniochaeta sp. 2T2.1]|nr:hypothetical protein GE09DRAFT_740262 [Coniochaeta sp. 2T2.1]